MYEISFNTIMKHKTRTGVKSPFHLSPEQCHFTLLDVERLVLPSDPRSEQVVMVFVRCHL